MRRASVALFPIKTVGVIKRTTSLITSGRLQEGDAFFSPCILLCHTACWESSATLQDDGQAVIIWKLLLFLKDREKRERMGRRAVGGFAMETVLERKHFFHSRYHFLFHQLSDLCRNGLICFETCLTTRPCQNPIL